MLLELSIRQLAVVESVRVSFRQGFHVLTGETGAGKSIIIDALSLIVGGRGSSDLVRYGSAKAEIEAHFEIAQGHPAREALAELGLNEPEDDSLIIRREITAQGKSSCRINGQLVNLAMLRKVGDWLVNIHGQHEHQSLLRTEEHLHWLDLYGDSAIGQVKKAYHAAWTRYTELFRKIRELEESGQKSLQMADLYRFQLEEIGEARLKIGEDASLEQEKRKLANAEKLYQSAAEAYDWLYGANRGLDGVRKAMARLEDIAALDPQSLGLLSEQVQNAFYQLEDAAHQIRDYRDRIEFNPGRLDQVEQRLDTIAGLRRKYGERIEDIVAYRSHIEQELEQLDRKDERIVELREQAAEEEAAVVRLGLQLSVLRKEAAGRLAQDIERELQDLQMSRTRFQVSLSHEESAGGLEVEGRRLRAGSDGFDRCEFMISANPGEPMKSLGKIASGGELSRIMLALKSIFSRMDRIPVLVFDEVDTGVSGRAAQAIAEKLADLSAGCQVFSITHLPQVACMAEAHYVVRKQVDGERTYTQVADARGDDRVEELARMLGGVEVTETTLHHAREMLQMAVKRKKAAIS